MSESSAIQKRYLRAYKIQKIKIFFYRILIFLVFSGIWEGSARLGLIDSFIFSSPSKIAICFYELLTKNHLIRHIGITLLETFVSFALVIFLSLGIAILLWFLPKVSESLEPYLVVLNSLPKSALAPLLIVWLGADYKTIVVCGMSVAIFGSILSLHTHFSSIDPQNVLLIYTLGGKKHHVMIKIILPSCMPLLFSLMRVNIGLCLVGVVIGEFIASREGLGYLIIYGSQVFKLDWVILNIFLLCLMAILLYALLGLAERLYQKHQSG